MSQVLTDNVDIARNAYDLFAKGDIETLVGLFAPDITWTEPVSMPEGGTHVGPDAILNEVMGTFTENWGEDAAVVPNEFINAEDRVIVLGDFTGTGKNGAYTIPFCHVLTFVDGKLAAFVNYSDTATALAAIS